MTLSNRVRMLTTGLKQPQDSPLLSATIMELIEYTTDAQSC